FFFFWSYGYHRYLHSFLHDALPISLGLTALLTAYAHALTFIKIAGGLYLLWLACKAFRSAASAHDAEAARLTGPVLSPLGYAMRDRKSTRLNSSHSQISYAVFCLTK